MHKTLLELSSLVTDLPGPLRVICGLRKDHRRALAKGQKRTVWSRKTVGRQPKPKPLAKGVAVALCSGFLMLRFDRLRQFEPILRDKQPRLDVDRVGSGFGLVSRDPGLLAKSDGILQGHAMRVFVNLLCDRHRAA